MKAGIRRLGGFAFATVILAVAAGVAHGAANVVPLPVLPQGPIEMRVAHVVNPRLPRMNPAQLQVVLAAIGTTAREHFGVDLRFSPIEEISIQALFERIPVEQRRAAHENIYDFKSGKGDLNRLAKAFEAGFTRSGESGEGLAEMIRFARPHVGALREESYEALGEALARLQLNRIERWKTIKALDGGPAIDKTSYNEFLMWNVVAYGDVPFELLLTNQLIASVEYLLPAIHAAIRGGYTGGLATYSRESRFKTVAIWSTFAFTSSDTWVREMRYGETYGADEAARLAGIAATHEIGHQLFHLLHPFGQAGCLMSPVPMLAYRAWAAGLSARECPIGSSPAMRPGGYKFLY